ncbi:unnamed protein product [Symbiodinium pilosum]|uniref:D-xylulose reductase A n=1 Tax=Symbiodinium pilosum TaxID=2952 RepID=A0A812TS03_SYMPI|nr:unnamed protein product [Symbiodinium pilosum]
MALIEEEVPMLETGEVLVRITHAGLCGSDLHYFRHGGLGSFKTALPMYMGHEPAGVIADANNCDGWAVGDRVAVVPNCPCLSSKMSMQGKQHLCERGTFMGAGKTPGCFANFVSVNTLQLVRIPSHVPLELAMLAEPLSVALHSLKLTQTAILDTFQAMSFALDGDVCILGAGAIGLCHLLLLKHAGARHVHMVEPLEERRSFALRLGASSAMPSDGCAAHLKASIGKGCEIVFDCAGTEGSFHAALQVAANAAQVVLVGIPEVDFLQYNPHVARTKELTILNARRANQTLATCLELLSSSVQLREKCLAMLTHRKVQSAFEMASSYADGVIKIALLPEIEKRSFTRIGLIGGTAHSVAYLRHLQEAGLEVMLVAVESAEVWPQRDESERQLSALCHDIEVPYFFSLANIPPGLEELRLDMLIDAGFNLQFGDAIVDMCTVDVGATDSAWEAVAASFGCTWCVLMLVQRQIFLKDMSMLGTWRASQRAGAHQQGCYAECLAIPNEGWVSWHWRGSFIQRFARSQQLDQFLTARERLQRFAAAQLGEVLPFVAYW